MNEQIYNRVLTMWGIQDALLQSSHSIFLTSQSVLFAVAVFVAVGPKPWFAGLLAVLAVYLIRVWFRVVRSRGYDVWFFHRELLRLEAGEPASEAVFTAFKKWQANNSAQHHAELADDPLSAPLLSSRSRRTIDVYIPLCFAGLWVALVVLTAMAHYRV